MSGGSGGGGLLHGGADDSDDDVPLSVLLNAGGGVTHAPVNGARASTDALGMRVKSEERTFCDDVDDDDAPLASLLPSSSLSVPAGKRDGRDAESTAAGGEPERREAVTANKFKRLKKAGGGGGGGASSGSVVKTEKKEQERKQGHALNDGSQRHRRGGRDDDDDDDIPISQLIANGGAKSKNTVKSEKRKEAHGSGDKHRSKAKRTAAGAAATKRKPSDKADARAAKRSKSSQKQRRRGAKAKKPLASAAKSFSGEDDSIKWHTLEHHGVVFPPEHEPHGQPLIYDGEEVALDARTEEVATFYAAKLETEYVNKPQFNKNFFAEFRSVMPSELRSRIRVFAKCDFRKIHEHLQRLKQEKQNMRPDERKRLREEETARVAKYTVARVDGREEKVANFRIEPPGLFLGRGEHPLMGKLKQRVMPEDVTLNLGRDAPVPPCPIPGRTWGAIQHNNTATWLAAWKDTVTGSHKYVFLNAASHFKSQSDQEKFEKARELSKHVAAIRTHYVRGYTSKSVAKRQRSVALYLIDKLALRVGNEKADDEADTVGCCSLRVEHLQLRPPCTVGFDFLGKDSMRYQNSVEVEPPVFRCLQEFVRGKQPQEQVFDQLEVTQLNDHLKTLMPGLSAKVFRTYNASFTLDRLLHAEGTPGDDTHDRVLFYNEANKEVAILCNHQRSLPKTHGAMMDKFREQVQDAKDYAKELQRGIAHSQKADGAPVTIAQWRRPKAVVPPNTLPTEAKRLREEAAAKPKEKIERSMKLDTMRRAVAQTKERVAKLEAELKTRDTLATVALGTSKINYLDPRITVAWCKRHEVPIERIFAKTLLEKFRWSMDASEEWRFSLTSAKQEADVQVD